MTTQIPSVPYRNSAAYKSGELIYHTGPKTEADLFSAIGFGSRDHIRRQKLDEAIETGWLMRLPGYQLDLTDFARAYFDDEAPETRPMGKVAEPRSINLMNRQAYKPPKRLPRDDEPEWSRRVGTTFFTRA